MIKRSVAFLAILLGAGSSVGAQDLLRYGSSLSSVGIGELVDFRASYAEALGITGVGLYNGSAPGFYNPAFLGTQNLTTAAFNANHRSITSSVNGGTGVANQLQFNTFVLQLPLIKNRLGASFTLLPVSERSYSIENKNVISPDDSTIRYNATEIGEGNLNRFEVGIGGRFGENYYAGYTIGWHFGAFSRENNLDFLTTNLSPARQVHHSFHRGLVHRFGFGAKLLKRPVSGHYLIAGATLELPSKLNVTRELEDDYLSIPTFSGGAPRRITPLDKTSSDTPLSIAAGASINVSRQIMTVAEVVFQRWSTFSHPDDISGVSYRNRLRVGGGVQFAPDSRLRRDFWKFYQYRAGAFHDTGYLSVDGNKITTTGITAGLSVPSPLSGSIIDVNTMLGFRGSAAAGMVKETIFQVRITLNLSEFMFFRRYIQ